MTKNKKLLSLLLILGLGSNLVACSVSENPSKEESAKEALVTENKDKDKSDDKDKEKSESTKEEADTKLDQAKEEAEYKSDVLVIGGGGAGLVSALSAAQEGANVIVLEKQAAFGGATSMSSGKIPAVNTKEQEEAGIEDSVEAMMRDINRAGEYTQNQELLKVASEGAKPVKEWLETQGIKWNLETNSIYYGQTTHRIHVAEGSGAGIVKTLEERINENPNIIALKNMEAKELISQDGKVLGAIVEKDGKKIAFKADKVILATSGFGANKEMIEKYTPSIANGVANVAPGATGDGILWGMDLGADTAAMNAYQGYAPISFESHKSLGSAFLDNGGILVNKDGKRFINEYVGYSPLATAIVNQEDYFAYMIWDKNIADMDIPAVKNIGEDELIEAKNIEDLAGKTGINKENLQKEFDKYQEGIEKGEDYLNRTKLPKAFEAPFYAVKVTGDYRHTQGGLVIDPETSQVLKKDGSKIDGLYGAGGVTEGFSSNGSNAYMAGNGLLQAFVYGRIAGINTAKNIENKVSNDEFAKQKDDLMTIVNTINFDQIQVSDQKYKDGTYKGTGKGHGGDIEVEVVVKDGVIDQVNILNHSETDGISDPAIKEIPEMIKKANGSDITVVSGATNTSNGIKQAVENALEEAK